MGGESHLGFTEGALSRVGILTRCETSDLSDKMLIHASVAQGIEHQFPKLGVGGSNLPGGTKHQQRSPKHRAALFYLNENDRSRRLVGLRLRYMKRAPLVETPEVGWTEEALRCRIRLPMLYPPWAMRDCRGLTAQNPGHTREQAHVGVANPLSGASRRAPCRRHRYHGEDTRRGDVHGLLHQ